MNNYRIEFGYAEDNSDIESSPNKYYKYIRYIKELAKTADITCFWHFYEPHVEITWISDDAAKSRILIREIENYLNSLVGIHFDKRIIKLPQDGDFADWWGRTKEENEFGAKVHALCSDFVDLYMDNQDVVDNGRGIDSQVARTIHRLCNPLGIGYWREAKLCFSRGLICLLFTMFSFERAVWIYRNIFRQSY